MNNELFDKEFVGENEEAEFYKNCKIKHINGDECKKSFEKLRCNFYISIYGYFRINYKYNNKFNSSNKYSV